MLIHNQQVSSHRLSEIMDSELVGFQESFFINLGAPFIQAQGADTPIMPVGLWAELERSDWMNAAPDDKR